MMREAHRDHGQSRFRAFVTHASLLPVQCLLTLGSVFWACTIGFPEMRGIPAAQSIFGQYFPLAILAWISYGFCSWMLVREAMQAGFGYPATDYPTWFMAATHMLGLVLYGFWALSLMLQGVFPVPSTIMTIAAFWVMVRTPISHDDQ